MRHEDRRRLAYQVAKHKRAGRSDRWIAKRLGIARKTVGSLLGELRQRGEVGESALERELGRADRTPKPSKLDPYKDRIKGWLQEYPDKTAERCHEDLLAEGFEGGYSIVRDYVRALRAELHPPPPKATPVHTTPGQRAEFDWSPYELVQGLKVQLWNAELRWSRTPFLAAETNTKQTTTLRNLVAAFESWGGVPHECLTDSMPGIVDGWEGDEPILNIRYVDLAAHYGFTALIAPRGCPQWKAVAERLFGYHEKNLLNGRTFRSIDEYREGLRWWREEKTLQKDHPESGRPVREMLELERPHLLPLPAIPYDTRDVVVRLIDEYQRVQLGTNHYPVPAPLGSRVYVCADARRVEVCDHLARRLIEHERLPDGAGIKLDPPHVRRVRYDIDQLVERVGSWGDAATAFAHGVREHRRYAGQELIRVLQLRIRWRLDDILEALSRAVTYRCFEVSKVERILELYFSPRTFEDQISDANRSRIKEVMKSHPVSQRPLAAYDTLRNGDRQVDPSLERGQTDVPSNPQQPHP